MADRVGQQFGNYQLIQLLGRGGFAEVYLAEHVRLGMQAAIKILYAHLEGSQISAFQQEARTIASLKHPHIIRVLDFDVQENTPFLVLDYAAQGSLSRKHPKGSKVPQNLVVTYVEQIASALHYAHMRKLIHRDIKPENILIGEHGELLLSDFGIATIAHSTSSLNTTASMGTLAYMAPEQIQGKPRPQSDQYALAVTVYHWLTGRLPFAGSSAEIIAQHLGARPPSLRTLVPELPAEVEQVVLTALAKDPQQRFGSVQAFANALATANRQADASSPSSYMPPAHSTQPASDAAMQQAQLLARASEAELSSTQPAQVALTPPGPSLLTRSIKQERSTPASAPRSRIRGVLIWCLLLLVTGSVLWFTTQGASGPLHPGQGASSHPHYRLSAQDTNVQILGIPLQQVDGTQKITIRVSSLQVTGNRTLIDYSLKGLDSSQTYYLVADFGVDESCKLIPPSTSLWNEVGLEFISAPQAGQEWRLGVKLAKGDCSFSSNSIAVASYQDLYFQF